MPRVKINHEERDHPRFKTYQPYYQALEISYNITCNSYYLLYSQGWTAISFNAFKKDQGYGIDILRLMRYLRRRVYDRASVDNAALLAQLFKVDVFVLMRDRLWVVEGKSIVDLLGVKKAKQFERMRRDCFISYYYQPDLEGQANELLFPGGAFDMMKFMRDKKTRKSKKKESEVKDVGGW